MGKILYFVWMNTVFFWSIFFRLERMIVEAGGYQKGKAALLWSNLCEIEIMPVKEIEEAMKFIPSKG